MIKKNREQKIEEMVQVLIPNCRCVITMNGGECKSEYRKYCESKYRYKPLMEMLYDAGYRKEDDTIDEVLETLLGLFKTVQKFGNDMDIAIQLLEKIRE